MQRGKFIVFEGGEGSGKSAHIRLTNEMLKQRHVPVITTNEPGGTEFGEYVRSLILENQQGISKHPISSRTELFLFLADRAQHSAEVIEPALMRGETVLCDRFTGSTLAYQIGGRKLPQEDVIIAMERFARNNLTPDLVLYLDIDPNAGLERKRKQDDQELNSFDEFDLSFHEDVRAYFKTLAATQPHWYAIDSNRTISTVQFEINQHVLQLYESSR